MELTKQPETEVQYWETIETLGGYIFSTSHALRHGHIKDRDGEVAKSIEDAGQISERLVTELGNKFGVIHPKDCPMVKPGQTDLSPPEGKVYYRDWYNGMKRAHYREYYDSIICSACPFSTGLQVMIDLGGVPCGIFPGKLYKLIVPYECGIIGTVDDWNTEELYKKIAKEVDQNALVQFQEKEKKLKDEFAKKPQ